MRKKIVTGLIICLFLISSVYAESGGNLHIGNIKIHPFTSVETKYNDNIYLESKGNENRDLITTTTLGFDTKTPLVFLRGDPEFDLNYAVGIKDYKENSSQDIVEQVLEANTTYDISTEFYYKIREKYIYTADPPNLEVITLEKRYRNILTQNFGYAKNRIIIDTQYQIIKDHYFSSGYSSLNKTEYIFTPKFSYQIFSKTFIFTSVDFGDIKYNTNSTNSDSKDYRYNVGLEGQISSKIDGLLKFGQEQKHYDESTKKDFNGLATEINLGYKLSDRTKLNFTGSRFAEESTYANNSYFISIGIAIKANHSLNEKLTVTPGVKYSYNKYPEETTEQSVTKKRRDYVLGFSLGFMYAIRDWSSVEIGYEYEKRNSNFNKYGYVNNQVFVKFKILF